MGNIRKMASATRKRIRPKLIAMQGGRCCYCAVEFDNRRWGDRFATFEHIQDRAKGGVNAQHNLAMACSACNFRASRENWSVRFKRARIEATNVIALADLTVEPMELPPAYIARVRRMASA